MTECELLYKNLADKFEAENSRLKEALIKYGRHTANCEAKAVDMHSGKIEPCDCGLAELLEANDGKKTDQG